LQESAGDVGVAWELAVTESQNHRIINVGKDVGVAWELAVTESQNHGIINVGKDLQDHQVQPSTHHHHAY